MHIGLHHAEKRKVHGTASFFDHFMIFAGLLGPIALIPQVITVWTSNDLSGVSLMTWTLLTAGSLIWFVYGVYRRLPALIVANGLLVILNLLVVVGVLANQ